MKTRCQCPKPEGVMLPNGKFTGLHPDNLIHFKPATMRCERCGRPICKGCSIEDVTINDCTPLVSIKRVCLTCVELEKVTS